MVGQWTATTKPSRSDEVLDADEQLRIANQIRAQFDSLAPKRPFKPNRSEPDHPFTPDPVSHNVDSTLLTHNIPELDKFRSLQSQSHAILSAEGFKDVQDEFVETQYYQELASVDKQHHATGSGFIKVVREEGEGVYEIQVPVTGNHVVDDAGENKFAGYRCNPATNDWVPNIDEHQVFVSSKPNRSESS